METGKIKEIGRFLLIFCVTFLGLYVSSFFYSGFVQKAMAFLQSALWNFLGKENYLHGTIIKFEKHSIEISFLCSGLIEWFVLVAAMVATPCKIRKKILGIGLSFVAVFIFNFFRIFVSTYVLFLNADIASIVHEVLFRISLFVIIAGIYYVWLNSFKNV